MLTADVAIVGLGPTGAVLAHLLALCDLRVVVFERATDIHPLPRAVHLDDEVMRILQTVGVADLVEKASRINPGMRFVDPDGAMLLDWPRPRQHSPQGWYPSYRFHQPDLESILRTALRNRPGVDVRLGHAVTRIAQTDDEAVLEIDGPDGPLVCRAAYAVGCDGARSTVRAAIGGGSEDLGFHERWLVVDVVLKRDRPDLGDFTIQHCHPTGAATYVRGPGARRRWEIALNGEDDAKALDPGFIWQKLSRWLDRGDAEIERAAVYEFHSLIALRWRDRRLFIAGDAAHQTPPFMGQGLCAGLRDAANLAWKIALGCRGQAGDWLESYETERIKHVRTYIETAVRLGRLINASDPGGALGEAFPARDGAGRMRSLAARLGPGPWPRDRIACGYLFAQPLLAGGQRSDDMTGYAPVLFTDQGLLTVKQQVAADAKGLQVITTAESPDVFRYLQTNGAIAVVTRPDRYVLNAVSDVGRIDDLIDQAPPSPLNRTNMASA